MGETVTLEQIQATIPVPLQTGLNWTAAIAGIGSFLTTWVPIVVGVMSGVWIGCQLWLFFKTKPWRKTRT